MKNLLLTFALLLAGITHFVMAAELNIIDPRFSEIRDGTVMPYFETLQKGEVASLHNYLSTRRYAVNQVLIEQNELYPDHLRDHFRDAVFDLVRVVENDTGISAQVKILWPDGRDAHVVLGLIEESLGTSTDTGIRWKIDRD